MTFIDTHAHIYNDDYTNRIDDLIKEANAKGVEKIISVGVNLATSEECVKLAEKYTCVYATCGFHPHEAAKAPKRYLYELEQFYEHPKVVAVGEIGLDYYYNFSDQKDQKRVYHDQLEMASCLELPVVVHCRNADNDILKGIQESEYESGVIHCFASDLKFANSIIEIGFHISFTGMITFVKELESVVREIPLEKMMLETDSPYLSPIPHRGKQNEPSRVIHIAEKIAELKEISLDDVAKSTTETAHNLFTKLTSTI